MIFNVRSSYIANNTVALNNSSDGFAFVVLNHLEEEDCETLVANNIFHDNTVEATEGKQILFASSAYKLNVFIEFNQFRTDLNDWGSIDIDPEPGEQFVFIHQSTNRIYIDRPANELFTFPDYGGPSGPAGIDFSLLQSSQSQDVGMPDNHPGFLYYKIPNYDFQGDRRPLVGNKNELRWDLGADEYNNSNP